MNCTIRRRVSASRVATRGFTLIEAMIAVSIAGTLAGVAWPSMEQAVLRARRMDAMVNLSLVQLAQERSRAMRPSYSASLDDIGVGALANGRHYALSIVGAGATGYDLLASATGSQARDAACRHLRLAVNGGSTLRASGPTAETANPPADNERCWQRALS